MDAESNESTEQPQAKGRGKLILILLVVAAVAAGAGAYLWMGAKASEEAAQAAAAEAESAEAGGGSIEDIAERLVPLEPLIVNLGGKGAPRYLKVVLELEVDPVSEKDKVQQSMPVLRDAVIVLLSSQRLADLQEFEGKVLLKEEILDRVNGALGAQSVKSVYFTEFIVQ